MLGNESEESSYWSVIFYPSPKTYISTLWSYLEIYWYFCRALMWLCKFIWQHLKRRCCPESRILLVSLFLVKVWGHHKKGRLKVGCREHISNYIIHLVVLLLGTQWLRNDECGTAVNIKCVEDIMHTIRPHKWQKHRKEHEW